jgi:DNA polymerase-3 subunit alpha
MQDILEAVPKPLFGKEATLAEIIQGNEDKNYEPHPRLATDGKYKGWYKFASQLEGMITNFGIHAGGVVISDFPIYEQVPMWKNSKSERITQFDMHEVEDLGLIKFDFLGVNNIDIIKEACRLVGENHGITLDPYQIPDHDKRAYALLNSGLLCGIFQMETSGSARDLIMQILPTSIEDLSDISALNRPGPLENHFHTLYMENKANGYAPEGINEIVADITKSTHYTIIYQEQVMAIVSRLAGFTLREADDVRRAMG